MRTLKHLGGIFLAAIGFMFLLSAFTLLFDSAQETPSGMLVALLLLVGIVPLGGAFILLGPALTVPSKPCPQCGSLERAAAGVLRKSQNRWLLHFGGWLLASLWGASREQQVRCTQCDTLYLTQTRGTRIAGILIWVVLLLWLFGIIAQELTRE